MVLDQQAFRELSDRHAFGPRVAPNGQQSLVLL
jgi:hypothetical protein